MSINQKFTGDTKQLEKELEKLRKEVMKLREENSKTAKESVMDSRRQEDANKRYAQSVKQDLQGPVGKYREELGRLRDAYRAGHLTQDEYRAGVDRLKSSVRSNSDALGENARVSKNVLSTALKFGGVAALWQTATSALAAYVQELQRLAELDTRAADAQAKHAQAQASFLFNTASLTKEQQEFFLGGVMDAAQRTGFSDLDAATAGAGAAFSAASGATRQEQMENALASVEATMQIAKQNPEQFGTFAGAAQDIGKVAGVKDPRQSLSFLANIMSLMRIEDPAMAKNVVKGISDMVATDTRGFGQQSTMESGAIIAALTQAMVDLTGDPSKTAGRQGSLQLEKFFSSRTDDPGNPLARLRALQASPELADEFLSGASLGESLPAWRMALDKNSEISKTIDANLSNLGSSFTLDTFNSLVERLRAGTPQIMASGEVDRAKTDRHRRELEDFDATRRTAARDRFDEILDKHMAPDWTEYMLGDVPVIGQWFSKRKQAEFITGDAIANSGSPEQAVIDRIRWVQRDMLPGGLVNEPMRDVRLQMLRDNPTDEAFRGLGFSPAEQSRFLELEDMRRELTDAKDRFEQYLGAQEEMEKQTALLQSIADGLKGGALPPQTVSVPQTETHR